MLNLTAETWLRFLVWMVLGFAIYFAYGYRPSRVGRARRSRRRRRGKGLAFLVDASPSRGRGAEVLGPAGNIVALVDAGPLTVASEERRVT